MKISEGIRAINETTDCYAEENNSNVLVRGPMNTLPYIFVFPKRTKSFDNCSVCVAWGEIADQNVPIQDIARILDVFQRWLDTPVAKRIPEKKYYLRAVEDHTVRYVCDICVGTDTCVKFQFGSKTEFSEDHLKSLTDEFSWMKPSIDRMKVEVDDE